MSLLPSLGPETSTAQEGELRVVGVDEDVAPIFDALSSETARNVLNEIYTNPGTPSEIANQLDMSIQSVTYHIEKLEDVDLIAVAGTRYSEKGHEMTVYEPPDDPVVLFVGTEERKRTLRSLVTRLVPTIGVLALASALVQSVYGGGLPIGFGSSDAGGPSGQAGSESDGDSSAFLSERADDVATLTPEEPDVGIAADGGEPTGTPAQEAATPAPEATPAPQPTGGGTPSDLSNLTPEAPTSELADGAASIDPGLAFFLGGVFVLCVVGAMWYYRRQ